MENTTEKAQSAEDLIEANLLHSTYDGDGTPIVTFTLPTITEVISDLQFNHNKIKQLYLALKCMVQVFSKKANSKSILDCEAMHQAEESLHINKELDDINVGDFENHPKRFTFILEDLKAKVRSYTIANSDLTERVAGLIIGKEQLESELAKSQEKCKSYEGALEKILAYSPNTHESLKMKEIAEQVLKQKENG